MCGSPLTPVDIPLIDEVTAAASVPLDPDLRALADGRSDSGVAGMPDTSVEENRRRVTLGNRLCASGPEVAKVEELRATSEVGRPSVDVRVYTPGQSVTATVVYLHGGGWFTGDLGYPDEFCRFLAQDAGVRVVSVDYRLAPEHPYPAPLDDAGTALAWAARTYEGTHLGIAGDSAGGNLAAATLLRARQGGPEVRFQVLIYPVVDSDFSRESYTACEECFPLGRADLQHCFDLYAPDPTDRMSPEVSPLRGTLADLPPALVVVAGHDPLHDEGVAFAEALREGDVSVTLVDHPTLCHGFLRFTGVSTASAAARDRLVTLTEQLVAATRSAPE